MKINRKAIFIITGGLVAVLILVSVCCFWFDRKNVAEKIKKTEQLTEEKFLKEISYPANPAAPDQILAFALEQSYEEFKNAYKVQIGQKVTFFGIYLSEKQGKVTVTRIKTPLHQISYLTNFQKIKDDTVFSIFDRNKKYTFNLSEIYRLKEKAQQKKSGGSIFASQVLAWPKSLAGFLISPAHAVGFTQESTETLLTAPYRLGQLYDLDPDCLINKVQDKIKEVLDSDECKEDCFQNQDCDKCEEELQKAISGTVDDALEEGLEECRYQYDLVVDHISVGEPILSGRSLAAEAHIDSIGKSFPKIFNAGIEVYDADNNLVYHTGGGGDRDYLYGDAVDLPALEDGLYHLIYRIETVLDDCIIINPEANSFDPFATCPADENTVNNTFDYYFEVLPRPNALPQIMSFTAQPNPAVMDTPDCAYSGCPLAARVTFNVACQDGDGAVVGYVLDYGDGQAESGFGGIANFPKTHSYFHPGTYPARIKCRDEHWSGWSDWDSQFVTVNEQTPSSNQSPSVYIDAPYPNPLDHKIWSEEIQSYWIVFHAHGSDPDGFILENQFEWDFGDNARVIENNTTHHNYQNPGNYTVRVRAKDNRGAWSNWDSTVVQILPETNQSSSSSSSSSSSLTPEPEEPQNSPPQISFPANVITKKVNEFFNLTATAVDPDSGGGIISYEWDLDGNNVYEWSSSVAFRPDCFFSEPGVYFAHLRVTDVAGLTATATLKIIIEAVSSPEPQPSPYKLNATFIPETVAEGENQKLILDIKNESEENITVQGAAIDWYWNRGSGFYLSEHQDIPSGDSHWATKEVTALTTKTVYTETSRASGLGQWRGEITVRTNAGDLTATVLHTIQ